MSEYNLGSIRQTWEASIEEQLRKLIQAITESKAEGYEELWNADTSVERIGNKTLLKVHTFENLDYYFACIFDKWSETTNNKRSIQEWLIVNSHLIPEGSHMGIFGFGFPHLDLEREAMKEFYSRISAGAQPSENKELLLKLIRRAAMVLAGVIPHLDNYNKFTCIHKDGTIHDIDQVAIERYHGQRKCLIPYNSFSLLTGWSVNWLEGRTHAEYREMLHGIESRLNAVRLSFRVLSEVFTSLQRT